MKSVKEKVKYLIDNLSDDCTIEDIQYQLYVVEKVQKGVERAGREGTQTQGEVERKFRKWMSE